MSTFKLTTNHAASSYGMPVLLLAGQAFGPGDSIIDLLQEEDKSIFFSLNDEFTAADWVYENLVQIEAAGLPVENKQAEEVRLFLGKCQHCTIPGARWAKTQGE